MRKAFKELLEGDDGRKVIILVGLGEGVVLLVALLAGVYFYLRT